MSGLQETKSMASSYVGRGFGHVNAAEAAGTVAVAPPPPLPAPSRLTLPPLFPVAPPVRETTEDFPTSINDMYRRQQQQQQPSSPRDRDDRDRRSEASSRSSSHSRHSRRSSGSDDEDEDRRYHSRSYDRYDEEEDEDDPRSRRSQAPPEAEEAFYDYRYLWATGFFLLLVAAVYFYWLNVYECCAPENEETNMTMQYAIDQFTRQRFGAGESVATVAVTPPLLEGEPGEPIEGA